jgi:uncharacterized protein YbbC (DUF1343 family)
MSFQLGIDRLLSDKSLQKELSGQRLALLGNQASMTLDFQHSLDALALKPEIFKLTAAFGPQHGMRGEKQDNMEETKDYKDPAYDIPVFSLYSHTRRPTAEMMKTFDVLLVDLQDVGTRIYTFLTTLLYVLEACSEHGKQIWVLDRPNPAGRPIEGTLLEKGWVSFVGSAEGLPMRHGMTMGEAARWFVQKLKIKVDLKVIEMKAYQPDLKPGYGWPTELPWVNPSPNASTVSMARCFPGTVLIEGALMSEGRGTTRPLETVGAPGLDMPKILGEMNKMAESWMQGCQIRICNFLPTFQKHAGAICSGMQIHVDGPAYNHNSFKPYRLIGLWLKAIKKVHPQENLFRNFHYEYEKDRLAFDLINGGPSLKNWIEDSSARPADFEQRLAQEEALWKKERDTILIYR